MSERELQIIPLLTRQDKVSIDVGAAHGEYTAQLVKSSRFVYAFEPLYELYQDALSAVLQNNANVAVLNYAISNQPGRTVIRVPYFAEKWQPYRASISQDFAGVPHQDYNVQVITLDSLGIEDVGFIKIDVEGNEMNVVAGALETIRRWRPVMLIEMEQRHITGDLIKTIELIESLGYRSYIFLGTKLVERSSLDLQEIQRQGLARLDPEIYLNNIIFQPKPASGNVGWVTSFGSAQDGLGQLWSAFDAKQSGWIIADLAADNSPTIFNGKLQRVWSKGAEFSPWTVVNTARDMGLTQVVLHYQAGLFPPLQFDAMVKGLVAAGIEVTLLFSSVSESALGLGSLGLCRHLVFTTADGLALAHARGRSLATLLPPGAEAGAAYLHGLLGR